MISVEQLRELLTYDPETAALTWRPRPRSMFESERIYLSWNAKLAGKPAFTAVNRGGYRHGLILAKTYSAHRVAWALLYGAWPHGEVDHENGNRTDNRAVNLRVVTRSGNQRNAARHKDNGSGVTGVHWEPTKNKWIGQIGIGGGVQRYLGQFDSLEDAAAARRAAEIELNYHPNHGRPQ